MIMGVQKSQRITIPEKKRAGEYVMTITLEPLAAGNEPHPLPNVSGISITIRPEQYPGNSKEEHPW